MSPQYPPPAYGGQPSWGPYGPPVAPPGYYATFGQRVVATLWDVVYVLPALALYVVAMVSLVIGVSIGPDSSSAGFLLVVIGGLLMLAAVVLGIWLTIKNVILRQGRTGYTWGKAKVGIRCILEINGQPCGVGNAVARYFLHGVINQACYLDYLWAIWDERNQTLTDKLLKTVVVNQPEGASAR
jgi:uncharacterized RDD family membrane protein YckC